MCDPLDRDLCLSVTCVFSVCAGQYCYVSLVTGGAFFHAIHEGTLQLYMHAHRDHTPTYTRKPGHGGGVDRRLRMALHG